MRTYALTDIHGEYDELLKAMHEIKIDVARFHPGAPYRVVFLGDYIDRGPKSCHVMEKIVSGPEDRNAEWVVLWGNHEDMLFRAHMKSDEKYHDAWMANGGDITVGSYVDYANATGGTAVALMVKHLNWMKRHATTIFDDGMRVFVHAGIDPTIPIEGQTETELLWGRKLEKARGPYERYIVHGHTPQKSGKPYEDGYRLNLDTGVTFGCGPIHVAVFDDTQERPIKYLTSR